jgi:hypothetical protein
MSQKRLLSGLSRGDLRRILARLAVVVLATVIVADLADGSCDPLPSLQGAPFVSGQQAHASDLCVDSCVPDCFCCSTPAPPAAASSIQESDLASERLAQAGDSTRPGFLPNLDHVPILAL